MKLTFLTRYQELTEEACEYIEKFFNDNPKVIINDFRSHVVHNGADTMMDITIKGIKVEDPEDEFYILAFKYADPIDIINISTLIQEKYDVKFNTTS